MVSSDDPGPGSDLAGRLAQLDYAALFLSVWGSAADELWAGGTARDRLEDLALDRTADIATRFLAAELLAERDPSWPTAEHGTALAPVYAAALRDGLAANGNSWGLPGSVDGNASVHALRLGELLVPALLDLLDDETPLLYEGSEEATIADDYAYRVKDMAAALIATLWGEPMPAATDPAERDNTISSLRQRAATGF